MKFIFELISIISNAFKYIKLKSDEKITQI